MLCALVLLGFTFVLAAGDGLAAQHLREDVNAALDWSGWDQDAAAVQMHMSREELNRQLCGHKPMTFLCRAVLLDGFWRELAYRQAERAGAVIVKHTDLQVLIAEVQALPKRMARMELAREKERTA